MNPVLEHFRGAFMDNRAEVGGGEVFERPAEGDYFKQGGVKTGMSQRVDAQQGRVQVGIIREPLSGTPGQGTVLKLRLKALVPGGAEVGVQSFSPVMLGGAQPPRAEVDPYRVSVK